VIRKWLVAIIDDELDIVSLFREALYNIRGVSIFTFTDPMAAFEHYRINNRAYVLVISDLRMPGMNGIDLVYEMKKLNPSVRTILMTAFEVNDNVFEEYIKSDVINGFLQKPIKLAELRAEVIKQINTIKKAHKARLNNNLKVR
jgi:DNA-binding NtrC family response regulator